MLSAAENIGQKRESFLYIYTENIVPYNRGEILN
jgi:hypothetical protein